MNNTPEHKWQIAVLLISLLLPIVFIVVLHWAKVDLSTAEDIVLGILLFIALLLLDILWLANKIATREARDEELWTLRELCDKELTNIRNCFCQIIRDSYGDKDLFVTHLMKQLHQLGETIKDVAEKRELRVQADHFLSVDNVLDAFQGDSERIWRYTWPIDAKHILFDDHAWKRYFEKTAEMVEQGAIKQIRTMLVLDEPKLVQAPRVNKLFDFFHTNKGFECFTINQHDYRSICANNGVPGNYIDFGIYGNRLLFLTEQYEPDIIGVFTKDLTTIQHYKSLFDSMWGSPSVARRNPSNAEQRVTLEELYEFDENQPL